MRVRRWGWLAAALGFAGAVLPGVAVSETTPTVEAVNSGLYTHYWSPSTVTVAAGGAVAIANPSSEVKHGVEWRSGPATPVCSGVPVGTGFAASGTSWSGSCTFPAAGVYVFYCTVHGAAMKATVTVSGGETTTTAPTTATTPTTTQTTAPPESTPPAALPSALAGDGAVKALAGPHGRSVRGSLSVSPAGAGGTLQVELLAHRGALVARAAGAVVVGRRTLRSLQAGPVRFSVPLDGRGLAALRKRGRLAVTVRIALTASGASTVHVTRAVTLRR